MEPLGDLARRCAELLGRRGWTLGLAESCTGGLLGHIITNLSGSSAFFVGGIVSYADAVKRDLLGVPVGLLRGHGAVSEPVARAMASGARRVLNVDVALSITGIAGPTGGTVDKPVGTVYIGIVTPCKQAVRHYVWNSDREGNKQLSVAAALQLLCDILGEG
jgi:PncC family amidohydrolase